MADAGVADENNINGSEELESANHAENKRKARDEGTDLSDPGESDDDDLDDVVYVDQSSSSSSSNPKVVKVVKAKAVKEIVKKVKLNEKIAAPVREGGKSKVQDRVYFNDVNKKPADYISADAAILDKTKWKAGMSTVWKHFKKFDITKGNQVICIL